MTGRTAGWNLIEYGITILNNNMNISSQNDSQLYDDDEKQGS